MSIIQACRVGKEMEVIEEIKSQIKDDPKEVEKCIGTENLKLLLNQN